MQIALNGTVVVNSYCCWMSLQIHLAGLSGEKQKIYLRSPRLEHPRSQWLYIGHLLWPLQLMEQRNRVKQKWTIHPANATKTTEVPLIGLTLRSIRLPHRFLHSGHILPLTLCCCNPPISHSPFTHYLQRDSSCSAKDALLYVYIPL